MSCSAGSPGAAGRFLQRQSKGRRICASGFHSCRCGMTSILLPIWNVRSCWIRKARQQGQESSSFQHFYLITYTLKIADDFIDMLIPPGLKLDQDLGLAYGERF